MPGAEQRDVEGGYGLAWILKLQNLMDFFLLTQSTTWWRPWGWGDFG